MVLLFWERKQRVPLLIFCYLTETQRKGEWFETEKVWEFLWEFFKAALFSVKNMNCCYWNSKREIEIAKRREELVVHKRNHQEWEFWENLVRIDALNVGGVPSLFYIELDGQDQLLLISSNGWNSA
jgi:hypothetical protein